MEQPDRGKPLLRVKLVEKLVDCGSVETWFFDIIMYLNINKTMKLHEEEGNLKASSA